MTSTDVSSASKPGQHSNQRLSVRRRGSAPTSATASAADDAIRQLIDGRRRLNKFGDAAGQPTDPREGLSTKARTTRAALPASEGSWPTLPPGAFKGLGIAGLVAVLVVGVSSFVSGDFQARHGIAGTVQLNGKPLADAVLEFHALGDDRPSLVLSTTDVGSFRRPGTSGLPEGSYAVVVKSGYVLPNPSADRGLPARIPDRYLAASSTPLRIKVAAENTNVKLLLAR